MEVRAIYTDDKQQPEEFSINSAYNPIPRIYR